MERVWRPRWNGPISGVVINQARKNLWRMPAGYGVDDLVQDGYLIFLKCKRRYGATCDGAPHFMSLCLTSFCNHLTDLANLRTEQNTYVASSLAQEGEEEDIGSLAGGAKAVWTSIPAQGASDADVLRLLEDAPPDIRRFATLMLEYWGHGERRPPLIRYRGAREPTAEYLCHLAGVSIDRSIIERLKAWLAGRDFPCSAL